MNQVDINLIKTGTVFPNFPKVMDVQSPHVINVKQDKLYALELEDETAVETRAREYRVTMNPFGQRAMIKQEFLYNTETKCAVGERYRFAPTKAVREIEVDKLDDIKWELVKKGGYGKSQLLRFTLRIGLVLAFLWLCLMGFNWFTQGEAGAKFLYKQMMDSYLSMEHEEISFDQDVDTILTEQTMDKEYFIIYDYVNDVVVQKYGEVMLFDMGEQGRYTLYLAYGLDDVPAYVKEYLPEQYFNGYTYEKQVVVHETQGDVYILEGDTTILYYPEGAYISSDKGIVKILFQEKDPIFIYGK